MLVTFKLPSSGTFSFIKCCRSFDSPPSRGFPLTDKKTVLTLGIVSGRSKTAMTSSSKGNASVPYVADVLKFFETSILFFLTSSDSFIVICRIDCCLGGVTGQLKRNQVYVNENCPRCIPFLPFRSFLYNRSIKLAVACLVLPMAVAGSPNFPALYIDSAVVFITPSFFFDLLKSFSTSLRAALARSSHEEKRSSNLLKSFSKSR